MLTSLDIQNIALVESASLLGSLPRIDLVTVSVAELQPMTIELSPAVAGALDEVDMVVRDLTETF